MIDSASQQGSRRKLPLAIFGTRVRGIQAMKRAAMKLNYRLSSRSRQIKLDYFWQVMSPRPKEVVFNLGATAPHLSRVLLGGESDRSG